MQEAHARPAQPAVLPPDDPLREQLHNEVHARPPARIRLPALIVYVAVLNDGIGREQECEHLRRLPGQQDLPLSDLNSHFLRLRGDGWTLKWERHTEFTRYSLVQPLPAGAGLLDGEGPHALLHARVLPHEWFAGIPGRTVAAVELAMVEHDLGDPQAVLELGHRWIGSRTVVASQLGHNGHSIAVTSFRLQSDGFERMLVIAAPGTRETRAGRIASRLLELETYRLMALRGLPAAKTLAPLLGAAEADLADTIAQLENQAASEQHLLDRLIRVAAGVERANAQHQYRFSATQAYAELVRQRIAELREKAVPGTQTLGEFMQRRLSPAIATVASTERRLASLSQRIERASALLRTRVDIATETQNQQLLAKLTKGQALQRQLQSTVEGLSIAAISYYMVSLLLYAGKAAKGVGLPVNPELLAGSLIPVVLWAVWKTTQRIHAKLHGDLH